MVNTKPLLINGGGSLSWQIPNNSGIINFLVLGNVGSGKSVLARMIASDIYMSNRHKPLQEQPMLIVSEIKQDDWIEFEDSPNVYLGWQAHKAIESVYNEMIRRQEDRSIIRTPLIFLVEEVSTIMASLEGKKKSTVQKMLKNIILTGRSRSIYCLFVSQDLYGSDLGDSNLRNQFSAILGLGNMASRSAVVNNIFDLEAGQRLEALPNRYGWYQKIDGSPPIKVKVKTVRDFSKMNQAIRKMLSLYESPLQRDLEE